MSYLTVMCATIDGVGRKNLFSRKKQKKMKLKIKTHKIKRTSPPTSMYVLSVVFYTILKMVLCFHFLLFTLHNSHCALVVSIQIRFSLFSLFNMHNHLVGVPQKLCVAILCSWLQFGA